jgi:DNA-binding XRE family transcriptional regulator
VIDRSAILKAQGTILRAARTEAGLSLAQLAFRINYSKSYLGLVETGKKEISAELVTAYDRLLRLQGQLSSSVAACEGGDDMRRRLLLEVLAAVPAGGFSDSRRFVESVRSSLVAALGISEWDDIAEEAGRRFMTASAAQSQQQLAGDLLMMKHAMGGPDESAARRAAPRLLTLYAISTANTGDVAGAARLYRSAGRAADTLGDPHVRQWVRGRHAFRRGYEGAAPDEILNLAHGVDAVEAHLARAHTYAKLGQRANALDAVRSAERAYAHAEQVEGTIYGFQPWRLALSLAYVFALLGDVDNAGDYAAGIDPPAQMIRWRAQRDMQQAVVVARSGDPNTGRDLAAAVLKSLPREQRSALIVDMWRAVVGDPPQNRS